MEFDDELICENCKVVASDLEFVKIQQAGGFQKRIMCQSCLMGLDKQGIDWDFVPID